MSYVIQHFYQPAYGMMLNPRLKLLLHCKNLTKLFLFLRFNLTMFSLSFTFNLLPSGGLLLYKAYFLKSSDHFDRTFYLNLTAGNTTNLHKNLGFYGFHSFLSFLLNDRWIPLDLPIKDLWFENVDYHPIQSIHFPLTKKFYKNVFLFLLLSNLFHWHAHTNKMLFYPMSHRPFYQLKAYRSYNHKFLKIFNI